MSEAEELRRPESALRTLQLGATIYSTNPSASPGPHHRPREGQALPWLHRAVLSDAAQEATGFTRATDFIRKDTQR